MFFVHFSLLRSKSLVASELFNRFYYSLSVVASFLCELHYWLGLRVLISSHEESEVRSERHFRATSLSPEMTRPGHPSCEQTCEIVLQKGQIMNSNNLWVQWYLWVTVVSLQHRALKIKSESDPLVWAHLASLRMAKLIFAMSQKIHLKILFQCDIIWTMTRKCAIKGRKLYFTLNRVFLYMWYRVYDIHSI